ncbi:hypothetical protein [Streptomyces hokutonensis]|uniref:hypothetical protein n=1 Tax=Streptomyces hokutonensis TaxID=1306990 RepID=UPI00382F7344
MATLKQLRDSPDAGRARLGRLPRPDHLEHHFIIDPDKWDFYEMDAYRLLRNDERAAEARFTLGVAAARTGDIDEAIGMGTTTLEADRKSLPSLLLVADELDDCAPTTRANPPHPTSMNES